MNVVVSPFMSDLNNKPTNSLSLSSPSSSLRFIGPMLDSFSNTIEFTAGRVSCVPATKYIVTGYYEQNGRKVKVALSRVCNILWCTVQLAKQVPELVHTSG